MPGKLVLVVDDEDDIVQLISFRLKKAGYQVATASDGKRALSVAGEMVPDLVMADIMMPNMGGVELCNALKSDQKTRDIPVIFISASKNDDTDAAVSGSCAKDFIVKPFHPEELLEKVKKHIKR
jgi:two-component system alkaline phosphatase synthesis response regulator PhoP